MHRQIKNLPSADILIHTGDITEDGTDAEFADFDRWLGEVKHQFQYIIIIPGNHDWHHTLTVVEKGKMTAEEALRGDLMKKKFKNGFLVEHQEVNVLGLRIFGSGWIPWHAGVHSGRAAKTDGRPARRTLWEAYSAALPGAPPHRFTEISEGVDILLTHGPSSRILDCVGAGCWGSSPQLTEAIMKTRPKLHMHGHLHEQRGVWRREADGKYSGGVEYCVTPETKETFPTVGPPPAGFPCELVSNNAMSNHAKLEHKSPHLAGEPRVILAEKQNGIWRFSVPKTT